MAKPEGRAVFLFCFSSDPSSVLFINDQLPTLVPVSGPGREHPRLQTLSNSCTPERLKRAIWGDHEHFQASNLALERHAKHNSGLETTDSLRFSCRSPKPQIEKAAPSITMWLVSREKKKRLPKADEFPGSERFL